MAIPLSQIVKILPGVLSPSGSALDLSGLILTENEHAPLGTVLTFNAPEDVSAYFGSASTESAMATVYFKGYKNSSRTPGAILFSRFNADSAAAWLRSGSMVGMTLDQLKLLSGMLTLTVDGTSHTSADIDLSSANSFAQAADLIEASIGSSVTVEYDTTQKAFVITSATAGESSSVSYATGTLSSELKLTASSGAVISQGAAPAVVADAMASVVNNVQNWAGFSTAFEPDNSQALAFSEWTNNQSNRFIYVPFTQEGAAVVAGSTETMTFDIIKTYGYAGVSPVYGGAAHAASVLGFISSLNFNQLNGRRSLAFRVLDGLLPTARNAADSTALIANGYNFYGNYAENAFSTNQWRPGSITGDYKWLDAYAGQIWLNANLQKDVITLFQSETYIPYASAGRAAIEGCMTSTIEQFKAWGGISAGTELDDNQIISIKNATGIDPTETLRSAGYYLYIGPFTAAMRAARTSPEVYLWYTDGGFIQQLTLNSIEVA